MIRLRHVAAINPGTPGFDQLESGALLPFVPLEAVWAEGLDLSRVKLKSEASTGYTRFQEGDIVVPKITPTFQADRSTIARGLDGGVAAGTTELHVVRVHLGVDERYVRYLLSSREFLDGGEAEMIGVAGQKRVPDAWLRDFRVPVTDVVCQQAIADYLDTETARIDALIAKKQRMIELLEARRGLYVRSVITGQGRSGAEDNSPKSSSLEALPDGWHWIRARFLCDVDTGGSDTDESSEDGPYLFFVRSQTPQRSDRFIFDGEAVLTAGDGAGVGKVFHHFVGRFDAHQRVYVMHRFRRVSGRLYFYALSTFFAESALDGSAKSTVDSVRRHMLTEMLVPVPPPEEQEQIVRHLDAEMERINAIIAKVASQIELLREHRQALITAAVTGELEVPGVAA